MGLCSLKIDRDKPKNVKIQILKNNSFLLKNCVFLNENCHFSKFHFLHFLLYLGQFLDYVYRPILPFWNSQSLIIKLMYAYQHNRK